MKKIITAVVLSVVLQGCAAKVVLLTPEQQVQVKSQLPNIAQNQAQVCFIRESKMAAQTWKPELKEAEKKIGELPNNSYFCHNTTDGKHKFVASTLLDYDREIDIALNKNARSYIDYSINMGFLSGNGELKEIDETQALNKIHGIDN